MMNPSRSHSTRSARAVSSRSLPPSRCEHRVTVAADTIVSHGKGTAINQDSFIGTGGDKKLLLGVFDGHGEHGHLVSNKASRYFARNLMHENNADLVRRDPQQAMVAALSAATKSVYASKIPVQSSGTTAVAVLKVGNRLVVGNIGTYTLRTAVSALTLCFRRFTGNSGARIEMRHTS
jgi:hypothetical protein